MAIKKMILIVLLFFLMLRCQSGSLEKICNVHDNSVYLDLLDNLELFGFVYDNDLEIKLILNNTNYYVGDEIFVGGIITNNANIEKKISIPIELINNCYLFIYNELNDIVEEQSPSVMPIIKRSIKIVRPNQNFTFKIDENLSKFYLLKKGNYKMFLKYYCEFFEDDNFRRFYTVSDTVKLIVE